jgi:hypothetical protein
MTATVNASTSAGVIVTSDTSGALALQTAGTTALTVTSGQLVGIGTTSAQSKLTVAGTSPAASSPATYPGTIQINETALSTLQATGGLEFRGAVFGSGYGSKITGSDTGDLLFGNRSNNVSWTETMRLDSSGNLGLGTTPSAWTAYTALQIGNGSVANYSGSGDFNLISNGYFNTGAFKYITSGLKSSKLQIANGAHQFFISTDGTQTAGATISYTQAMVLDNSGRLLIGTTSTIGSGKLQVLASSTNVAIDSQVAVDGSPVQNFRNSAGSQQGYVLVNTSGTVYSTTSDYRLKQNIVPMTGALTKVAQLKPVTYKWKVDGSDSQGFIAHELQAVVPECVTGTKDEVDADGNPKYQGIDTSFLVATLTAAIQELSTQLTELKAEVATLRGA